MVTIFGLDLGRCSAARSSPRRSSTCAASATRRSRHPANDLPVILGVTMFAAFFIVIINLIVDLLYGVIDPRVRLG